MLKLSVHDGFICICPNSSSDLDLVFEELKNNTLETLATNFGLVITKDMHLKGAEVDLIIEQFGLKYDPKSLNKPTYRVLYHFRDELIHILKMDPKQVPEIKVPIHPPDPDFRVRSRRGGQMTHG